ncbi:hypothetical protein OG905_07345 [Streptomyces sp. NBC_00322]|uniref:hypothetical protein n=1 Tax=Streptomyces sp. NBC_00322 TaxID=2975712 RepID=UPI002E2D84DA|nr:hypothetical protein [Streptomyces sp. NBC_00322]
MTTVPLLPGTLEQHPDGTYLCLKCDQCREWHCAPVAADMKPGMVTHLIARCTTAGSRYRATGYNVKITRKRTRRSRSCARGRFWWSLRPTRTPHTAKYAATTP